MQLRLVALMLKNKEPNGSLSLPAQSFLRTASLGWVKIIELIFIRPLTRLYERSDGSSRHFGSTSKRLVRCQRVGTGLPACSR